MHLEMYGTGRRRRVPGMQSIGWSMETTDHLWGKQTDLALANFPIARRPSTCGWPTPWR